MKKSFNTNIWKVNDHLGLFRAFPMFVKLQKIIVTINKIKESEKAKGSMLLIGLS